MVYQWIVYAVNDSITIDNKTKVEILKEILSREDLGFDRSRVLVAVTEAAKNLSADDQNEILAQLKKLQ
ncbi:MAG: hypothetical protein N3A54_07505, partial [Patescibacteria group bacterium]|nr:hypothetical protein [Patescibacteria group bacterium]